ncbi:MAG: protein phosphatase 2C domain-containing protein, partial [Myxococcota bacterium]
MWTWHGIGQSSSGQRRLDNQDAFVADDALGLYAVSDGMGGHAAGDVASSMAVASVRRYVADHAADAADRAAVVALAARAVMQASGDIYDRARAEPDHAGMGCTLTVVIVRDGYAAIAHVGDSRAYLQRDTEATQLTTDHTVGADLARAEPEAPPRETPYAGVLTRTVGTQASVTPDTLDVD